MLQVLDYLPILFGSAIRLLYLLYSTNVLTAYDDIALMRRFRPE